MEYRNRIKTAAQTAPVPMAKPWMNQSNHNMVTSLLFRRLNISSQQKSPTGIRYGENGVSYN